ncbi:aminoglycoside phosphotransferase family protein [Micromonospora sp. DR5-3]|uniref:phosphotransferase family protein n=1 Tax=unclassified Micromonospora TaxID=2617518 RepID=UPI0011D8C60F|nr:MULTISPECIES: aminoglycoside phosphotransferase family protein [unclassified Micromonospora]MCW3814195.1 aminoglycoside phosphotransferase family protein [Micromonospora sp. DR5-3]TYC25076.1 aminoglycoside phosphotransferase family protein [Micromonospora sp. MP36]
MGAVHGFVKRRGLPEPGSIPDVLDMFRAEVRFYREIAPVVGVRVPNCLHSEITPEGTTLVLEDLSAWQPGADPIAHAHLLSRMHQQWAGQAPLKWPWLRPVGAAADLVGDLFDQTMPMLAARPDLPANLRRLAERLVGQVPKAEQDIASAGPLTLVHGDASARNVRTGPNGELALLDWEDVSAAPGVVDLAWLLLSSVDPSQWPAVIAAYGAAEHLMTVLPAVVVQGFLCFADAAEGSGEAQAWVRRLNAAEHRLGT